MADALDTQSSANPLPLVVDMDGALLRTDTTFEGLARGLFAKPLSTLAACAALLGGRARFKRAIAEVVEIDVELLPVRENFVAHLAKEHAAGRDLHLVSGSDHAIVERVAQRIGLFATAQGSAEGRNLKGGVKAQYLEERFGEYAYAGDSPADLKVWRRARGAVLVGASPSTARKARKLNVPIEAEFLDPPTSPKVWLKALRLHQWAKNILIFIPLLLSGRFHEPGALVECLLGFLLLGVTASGAYVINDLSDLAADRRHRSKKNRPFASGALKVHQGLLLGPALIIIGVVGAWLLSPAFALALLTYLVTTLAYTLWLKQAPFLDAMLLGWLYTLRLLMGSALAAAPASEWLLTFSMFFFFSLSLAKRHVEVSAASAGQKAVPGRGYQTGDAPLTLAFGVASTTASLLILTQYLMVEAFPSGVYARPQLLWFTLPIIGLWTMRVWLLAHRGELDDDPVTFAVKDPMSIGLGAALALVFMGAVLA